MAFSALTGDRPRVEALKLDQAEEAFAKGTENRVRFRAVLAPQSRQRGARWME